MYDCCENRYGKMEIKWLRTIHQKPAEGVINNHCCPRQGRPVASPAENTYLGGPTVGYLG